jgi:glycosyltransferase involved in cell wall biosynthesis
MHTVIQRNAKIYNNALLNQIADLVTFTLTKLLTEFSCKVIVHNQLMKKVLEENYGCKTGKVVTIPHGVVKADLEYRRENGSRGNLTILSLGFLREEKKLEHLIQGFSEFSKEKFDAKLLLVGNRHPHEADKYVDKIVKLVSDSELGGKVHMTDFASDEHLNQLISNSNLIILVSTTDYFIETSGALARVADFGKPVVCSKVPKFQGELKDGIDCIMVSPGNVDELVKAMKTLADNQELKRQLASNLKRHFSERYWTDVAKMHLNCYYSCLKLREK